MNRLLAPLVLLSPFLAWCPTFPDLPFKLDSPFGAATSIYGRAWNRGYTRCTPSNDISEIRYGYSSGGTPRIRGGDGAASAQDTESIKSSRGATQASTARADAKARTFEVMTQATNVSCAQDPSGAAELAAVAEGNAGAFSYARYQIVSDTLPGGSPVDITLTRILNVSFSAVGTSESVRHGFVGFGLLAASVPVPSATPGAGFDIQLSMDGADTWGIIPKPAARTTVDFSAEYQRATGRRPTVGSCFVLLASLAGEVYWYGGVSNSPLTVTGTASYTFNLPAGVRLEESPPERCASVPPEPEEEEPCPKCGSSAIWCENQSLTEAIPLAGAPFLLYYHSEWAAGRLGAAAAWQTRGSRLGGWTAGEHHVLDPAAKALYLGDGQRRKGDKLGALAPVGRASAGVAATDYLVASDDGGEIYHFDQSGRHLRTLDALSGTVLYQFGYDGQGALIRITDGDGDATVIERDSAGRATAIVSPYGQRTRLAMDAQGNLVQVTNPKGESVQMKYAAGGLLTEFTDANGKPERFSYDGRGRLVRLENRDGGLTALELAEFDGGRFRVRTQTATGQADSYQVESLTGGLQRRVITHASGLKTVIERRADGSRQYLAPDRTQVAVAMAADPRWGSRVAYPRTFSITLPSGLKSISEVTRSATLAEPGNPLSLTSQTETVKINGRTFTAAYTAADRTMALRTPQGRETRIGLDAKGNLARYQIGDLAPVSFGYDSRGRLVRVEAGEGEAARTHVLGFGATAQPETLTDALGRKLGFQYDAAERITALTFADGRTATYTHDGNGRVTAVTPPGRRAHTFTFTAAGRRATYTPPAVGESSGSFTRSYDRDGRLARRATPDGQAVEYGYDAGSRLVSMTLSDGTVRASYDAATGNLVSVTAREGNRVEFTHDGPQLITETWTGEVSGSVGRTWNADLGLESVSVNGEEAARFRYDDDGLLIQGGELALSRSAKSNLVTSTALAAVADQRTYNSFGELTEYSASFEGTELYRAGHTRDKAGRLTGKVETVGEQTESYAYEYDAAGRLATVTRNGEPAASYRYDSNGNRLEAARPDGAVTGTYDEQDRLVQYGAASYVHNAAGMLKSRTTAELTTSYDYDLLGNLRAVTLDDGRQVEYVVDGLNRRIGKKVDGALVQGFLYLDRLTPVAELDGNNGVVSRFVYATRRNVPDYMVKDGVAYRIVTDHLGSPRLVVNMATGEVAQRMDYDEFGNVTRDTNPDFQPFGFAGGLWDRDTRLVRFGARDYDPETGRWTAPDPLLFAGGDTNLYAYALNSPQQYVDPTGRWSVKGAAAAGWGGIKAGAKRLGEWAACVFKMTKGDPGEEAVEEVVEPIVDQTAEAAAEEAAGEGEDRDTTSWWRELVGSLLPFKGSAGEAVEFALDPDNAVEIVDAAVGVGGCKEEGLGSTAARRVLRRGDVEFEPR